MRKLLCLVFSLVLACSCALAEPRYPDKQGPVTDAAAVLSQSTTEDLAAFAEMVDDETSIHFYVATVDFLDGETLNDYAHGLRSKWRLGDDDLLLLLAVGKDKFGSFGGEDVNSRLSALVQDKLLSTRLEGPFLLQRYDEALAAYIPALTEEINKAFDENIRITGLFGQTEPVQSLEDWAEEWSSRWAAANQRPAPSKEPASRLYRVTQEDKDTGFSLGKVILTIFLLTVIFGKKKRYGGCGCGCAPFSRLLAALGLWRLWDEH